MKRIPILPLVLSLAFPAFAQERPASYRVAPTEPGAVKIYAWNMQWFPSGAPEPKSPKDEADRIDSAARVLAWQNADIVMLEEMRDRKTCEALVSRPALAGRGFRVNVCSDFSPPPSADAQPLQQDAVVSRFPAVDSGFMEWNRRRTPAAPPRGLAWCVLDVEGELWAFVVVHLKSNRIGEWVEDKEAERRTNAAKREESARQLVAFAKANLEGRSYGGRKIANVFIGGDFNTDPMQEDYAGEATVPTLVGAGYADAFAGEPVEKRYTMDATRWYPASVFDYLFHKGTAKLFHPEVAPRQYTSDHRMVCVQATTAAASSSQPVPDERNPPSCPKCGAVTKPWTSPQDGRKFWGCSRYPVCRGYRELSR